MVGDGVNDIDAIISSNVGIYIGQQKNINTLLSHYFIDDNSLMNIETIIKNGRGYNENDILLLPANFIFTSCWVGLITYSYFLEKQVDNTMLTLLNLSIFILCVSAFSIQPDYKINFNYLVSNEKLIRNFKLFRFFGIFIIKIICQIFFYFTYDYNEIIDNDKNKEIILGYIFIMTWSQSMSSVLVFNISTFYRKSILSNLTFLLIYVLIFFYILYLLTLNDISLGQISIININFELSIKNIDFFDDNHKIIVLFIILSDIFIPCILVIVLKIIYEKKAQKYKVDNMEKNEIN
jgi:magnesium-transporting ATPase (P-type)